VRWTSAACGLAAALALAAPAHAGGPAMRIGAVEDAPRSTDLSMAKAQMTLARLAGFDSVRITQIWAPGETAPTADDVTAVSNVVTAADLSGMRVFVTVMPFGSKTTPLGNDAQAAFAQFAAALATKVPGVHDVIVGNEPNLNRFWLPQFNPDGSDAAAPAYETLLAATYDALKAVSPAIEVYGGAVSPRGGDKPGTGRDTHSPTVFIADLGAAYRASGRTDPIMDVYVQHVYEDNSSSPPSTQHAKTTTVSVADYAKLVKLLGAAFDGTGQPGSTLPILYGEFGVESQIPAAKASLYTGTEPATTKPVDEATQALYYSQAVQLAFCQPNVMGLFLFHAVDETLLAGWQSGVYYVDGKPKPSRDVVRTAAVASRRGIVARCPGLALRVKASVARIATTHFHVTCNIDCTYTARLVRVNGGATAATVRGRVTGGVPGGILFPKQRPGIYRIKVTLVAPVNPGPPSGLTGQPFRLS
jgi:hypothetical protein